MTFDSDRIVAGVLCSAVGLAVFLYGPRLVGLAQDHTKREWQRMGVSRGMLDTAELIMALQRLAVRAFGVWGLVVGFLLFLDGLGTSDWLDPYVGWIIY